MNKSTKIILIIVAACVVLGGVLAGIGFAFGAARTLHFTMKGKDVEAVSSQTVSGSVDLSDFDTLNIEVASMDVKILEGDSYRLEYTCKDVFVPEVNQSGKTLSIKQPTVNVVGAFNINLNNDEHYYLYVPKTDAVVNCDIRLTSGEFDNDILNLDGTLKMTSGDAKFNNIRFNGHIIQTSGEISMNNVSGDKIDIEKTSGDIKCDNCSYNGITLGSTSGSATFEKLTVNTFDFDLTSGEIEINLTGSKNDYNYSLSCASGDITVGDSEYGKKLKEDNGASGEIKGHTTSGDIDITF